MCFVKVNLKYIGTISWYLQVKSKPVPKLVPEFFADGHNFVPIPITKSQLGTGSTGKKLGIILGPVNILKTKIS